MDKARNKSALSKYSKMLLKRSIELPKVSEPPKQLLKSCNIKQAKKEQVYRYICQRIPTYPQESEIIHHKKQHDEDVQRTLLESAQKSTVFPMSRFQLRDIMNLVKARGLEEKHPEVLDQIVQETKEEYCKITALATIVTKVKPIGDIIRYRVEPYKYFGKTSRYHLYLKHKKQFSCKYLLHNKFIRSLVRQGVEFSNKSVVKFDMRYKRGINFDIFKEKLDDFVIDIYSAISEFYYKIALSLEKLKDKVNKTDNFLNCCSGLISIFISLAIGETLNHIVTITSSTEQMPLLNLYLDFEDNSVLYPSNENVLLAYELFIKSIRRIPKQINDLQSDRKHDFKNRSIMLCLTQEFIHDIIRKMTNNVSKIFRPVLTHIKELEFNFQEIYPEITSQVDISDLDYDTTSQKIMHYRKYIRKISLVPAVEYFVTSFLYLRSYICSIRKKLDVNAETIFHSLRAQNEWEINDLNETYNLIATKATLKPCTTEQIIEIGRYMVWVKAEYLSELKERAYTAFVELLKIIDLGILPDEHISLNSTLYHWMDDVVPIVEYCLVTFDQLKFEAEDKLQRMVEDIDVMVKEVHPFLRILDEMDDIKRVNSYLNALKTILLKIKAIEDVITWINNEEKALSFPPSSYVTYEELKNYVYPFHHLLNVSLNVQRNVSDWLHGQFDLLTYEETAEKVDNYCKELTKMQKEYRTKLRQAVDDNVPIRFRGTVDDPDVLNWPAPLKICVKTLELVENFKPCLRLMKILCNKALMTRHWKNMSQILGQDIVPNAGTTLDKFMHIDFQSNIEQYEIISKSATKEKELHERLITMIDKWNLLKAKTKSYEDNKVILISNLDKIEFLVEDHEEQLIEMKSSSFFRPHESEINAFQSNISQIKCTIKKYANLQSEWFILFSIYNNSYTQKVASEDYNFFQKLTTDFNKLRQKLTKKKLIKVCQTESTQKILKKLEENLKIAYDKILCLLSLIREEFPRYYFLSNEEIFEIMSESRNLNKTMEFLPKCFPNTSKVIIKERSIEGIRGLDGDYLKFLTAVPLPDDQASFVKLWQNIESSTKTTIAKHIRTTIFDRKSISTTIKTYSGQICLIFFQIRWTLFFENYLKGTRIIKVDIAKQVEELSSIITDETFTIPEKNAAMAMLLRLHLYRDLYQQFMKINNYNENEFKWLAQVRYHLDNLGVCMVDILKFSLPYGCEFYGTCPRLSMTPSTERCFVRLMSNINLHVFSNLSGTKLTGKTDTIKDFANVFGMYLVTLKCSELTRYDIIQRFITGIEQCGSWLFLEEISRVKPEILSIISDKLLCISTRRQELAQQQQVNNPLLQCAVFATTTDEAKFSELPANFRGIFRNFNMIAPDFRVICESYLFSYGVENAEQLSKKIVALFHLLKDLIPDQQQNIGIANLKLILIAVKEASLKNSVVIESIIFEIFEKQFSGDELEVFTKVYYEVFSMPNLETNHDQLEKYLKRIYQKDNLQLTTELISSAVSINEFISSHQNIIVVGKSDTGKTTSIKMLHKTLNYIRCKNKIQTNINLMLVNPTSLTEEQLFGHFNSTMGIWKDGWIGNCLRKSVEDTNSDYWIYFDSPIESWWTEKLLTVLDTKVRKMFLLNGESIFINRNVSFVFEDVDLSDASPSLVATCRIFYIREREKSWQRFTQTWIRNCNPIWSKDYNHLILNLFDWLIPACHKFTIQNCSLLCTQTELNITRSVATFTKKLLDQACNEAMKRDEELKTLSVWIQASFFQAVLWAIGGLLDTDSRAKFDDFFKDLLRNQVEGHQFPESLDKIEVSVPTDELFYEYNYIYRAKGTWKFIGDVLKNEITHLNPNILETLIPTVETMRYNIFLEMTIKDDRPLIFVGPEACGKSSIILQYLEYKLNKTQYLHDRLHFSRNLGARVAQNIILSKLDKIDYHTYSIKDNRTKILYIDDINMVANRKTKARPVLELIRQYFDHKYWFALNSNKEITVSNLNFVGTFSLGLDGENLNHRFLRHFNVFAINSLSESNCVKIYGTLLELFWKQQNFPTEVLACANHLASASYTLWKYARDSFKLSLENMTNVFSMREIAKFIYSCTLLKKEHFDSNKKFHLKFWIHESLRIIGDRLRREDDVNLLFEKMKEILESFEENFENVYPLQHTPKDVIFSHVGHINELGRYDETDIEQFKNFAISTLDSYNRDNFPKLNIVLFDLILRNLLKLCRNLYMTKSSVLFFGCCSCGKYCLTKMASFICQTVLFLPEVTIGYTLKDFHSDIKKALEVAGGKGKHTIFLLKDKYVKTNYILDDLVQLIKFGEIVGLYNSAEKEHLLNMVRIVVQGGNPNVEVTADKVFRFFIDRCQAYLHIIFCLGYEKSITRKRLSSYPQLLSYCNVIWFEDWPDEALEQITIQWLADANITSNDLSEKISKACIKMHRNCSKVYKEVYEVNGQQCFATLGSYIELVQLLISTIHTKKIELMAKKQKFVNGLDKLVYSEKQIDETRKSLAEYQPQIRSMTQKAIEMSKEIARETIEVEKASELVRKDEMIANQQAAAAQILKTDCEADLAQAIPILEDAIEALNTLKPTDITLVKSMKNPPDTIKLVMAAVCVIKEVKPDRIPDPSTGRKTLDYWGPSKRILGDMNFLQTLKEFDKDDIKPEVMVKIRGEYLSHKDFVPSAVAKASSAAEGLCKWIIAMSMYDKVAKEVAPKKEKLEYAEQEYAQTLAILEEKKEEVAKLEERLAKLNAVLAEANLQQKILQRKVDLCNKKLSRALTLLGGLEEEKQTWMKACTTLQSFHDCLPGDALASSALISYLAPLTSAFRLKFLTEWIQEIKSYDIPFSESFSFRKVFCSEENLSDWYYLGLPNDNFSIDGAVIQKTSHRWALFIDPQMRALQWIKHLEKRNGLCLTSFDKGDCENTIEYAVTFGKPLIIENVSCTFNIFLDGLYSKVFSKINDDVYVHLGKKKIRYDSRFKLYMTTRSVNQHFSAEVYDKVKIINFNITSEALEEMLLGILMKKENTSLKKNLDVIKKNQRENREKTKLIQEKILIIFFESKEDILEDEMSLKSLERTKRLLKDLSKNDTYTKDIKEELTNFEKIYETFICFVILIYYTILDMSQVNYMYQFSVEWFLNHFLDSIRNATACNIKEKRVENLINTFTTSITKKVRRGLFQQDIFVFSFLLWCRTMLTKKLTDERLIWFFLNNDYTIQIIQGEVNKTKFGDKVWKKLLYLEKQFPQRFDGLLATLEENQSQWKQFLICGNFDIMPGQFNKFENILLLSILHPHNTIPTLRKIIAEDLNPQILEPLQPNISDAYIDSYSLSPLIFILSHETQPELLLLDFAEKKKFGDKLHISSVTNDLNYMENLIKLGQKEGLWVCFLNCHLNRNWLLRLEKIFNEQDFNEIHENYRLWLTTEYTEFFPCNVLQNSVKMTYETFENLQQNMLRLYQTSPINKNDFYYSCPRRSDIFNNLLFEITYFHSLLQTRKIFGPFGYSIPYFLSDSDINISLQELKLILDNYDDVMIPVKYIIGDINYAFQFSDKYDQILVKTLFFKWIQNHQHHFKHDYNDVLNYIKKSYSMSSFEHFDLDNNVERLANVKEFRNFQIYTTNKLRANNRVEVSIQGDDAYVKIQEILQVLPNKLITPESKTVYDLVLIKEIRSHNHLITFLRNLLSSLLECCEKNTYPSLLLRENFERISKNLMPLTLEKYSYKYGQTFTSYIHDLAERVSYFEGWSKAEVPRKIWISAFFHPNSLLAAFRIDHARRVNTPLENVSSSFSITQEGLTIYGLHIMGALWDKDKMVLRRALPNKYFEELPEFNIKPILFGIEDNTSFCCPVYKTGNKNLREINGDRSNYIFTIQISDTDPTYWIKSGSCLTLQSPSLEEYD